MGRKLNKSLKHEKAHTAEKESLLQDQNPPLRRHHTPANLRLPEKITERKKSIWAPLATATTFEDVPVFTICPYCSSKVVTKTQFKKAKKHWYERKKLHKIVYFLTEPAFYLLVPYWTKKYRTKVTKIMSDEKMIYSLIYKSLFLRKILKRSICER